VLLRKTEWVEFVHELIILFHFLSILPIQKFGDCHIINFLKSLLTILSLNIAISFDVAVCSLFAQFFE
jgi:hypothetical protein